MDKDRFDGFQYWLMDMDDAIERFFNNIPHNVRNKLDFSVESLLVLEEILMMRYPDVDTAMAYSEAKFLDGSARYIGEVFRKWGGGKWYIKLEDEKNVYYKLPQLKGVKNQGVQICPLALTTTAIDRRKGNFIHNSLKRRLKEY